MLGYFKKGICKECGNPADGINRYLCAPCRKLVRQRIAQENRSTRLEMKNAMPKGYRHDKKRNARIERDLLANEIIHFTRHATDIGQSGPCRSLRGTPEFSRLATAYLVRDLGHPVKREAFY